MSTIHHQAIVPYSPEQMFALVNDINSYPDFLPWCAGATIHSQSEEEIIASLTLRVKGIEKSFTTCNVLHPSERITLSLREGPFKKLAGQWLFKALGQQGCAVSLDLNFELNNRLLNYSFGQLFKKANDSLVQAFTERAGVVYGHEH